MKHNNIVERQLAQAIENRYCGIQEPYQSGLPFYFGHWNTQSAHQRIGPRGPMAGPGTPVEGQCLIPYPYAGQWDQKMYQNHPACMCASYTADGIKVQPFY